MKTKIVDSIALSVMVGTVALTGVLYSALPSKVPTHFDFYGAADGWMDKAIGSWILPLVALTLWLLLRFGGLALRGEWRERFAASPMPAVAAMMVALLSAIQAVILYAAIFKPPSIDVGIGLVLGGFWVLLGLVVPKVRRNPWVGVRTAWTLSSNENWARTHRLAGHVWVIAGGVALACVAFGRASAATVVVVASAMVPAVYSFFLARRLPPSA